ncbi:MAG: hypothetical protein ACRD2H_08945 [Terriglobales bacterium]
MILIPLLDVSPVGISPVIIVVVAVPDLHAVSVVAMIAAVIVAVIVIMVEAGAQRQTATYQQNERKPQRHTKF